MNTTKIAQLKEAAIAAQAVYVLEQQSLVSQGFKSQARYELLKPLKAAADVAFAEYSKFAKGQINKELCAIIASGKPARDAAARARSPWKQAKFDAANKA